MRWAVLSFAVAAASIATAPALSCEGKNVLFHDNFTTADAGWAAVDSSTVKIGGGTLKLAPAPRHYTFMFYRGDAYQQGDACVNVSADGQSAVPDGDAGLIFGYEDFIGFYYFSISPKTGTGGILHYSTPLGKYQVAVAQQKIQAIDTEAGAKNVLGVTINGARAVAYVNDRAIFQLSVQPSKAGGIFGLMASSGDKAAVWAFDSFRITGP